MSGNAILETLHCYGAFESDGVDAFIFDLFDSTLHSWDELSASERRAVEVIEFFSCQRQYCGRDKIFKLVQGLHRIGIVHNDPNISRIREVDFI